MELDKDEATKWLDSLIDIHLFIKNDSRLKLMVMENDLKRWEAALPGIIRRLIDLTKEE